MSADPLEPEWPSAIHDGCNYNAMRPLDDSGLFCPKCGWGWSATAERLKLARAELAALKARRCDGCVHYGRCDLVARLDAPAMELDADESAELLVDADHACNAWTPKPPAEQEA